MKALLTICRIFVGLVFIFSGFTKAVDPSGFAIKLEEYFIAFNLHFLVFTAMPVAIFFSSTELMIGLNLILGLKIRFTSWLLLLFMSYFTILTFILALTNPVTDCGCFGDAIKLTNWQTFGKNIILFVPTIIIFLLRKKHTDTYPKLSGILLVIINLSIPTVLSLDCLRHQPLIDFRPYKTGTYIPDEMIIPEGAPTDIYKTILIYEKEGVKKEFSESNFPWQDTTWKWVETKQKLISKGYEPPIHDFSINTLQGSDITDSILKDKNYTFLIIAPKLEQSDKEGIKKMNDIALKAKTIGMKAYCLTSSASADVDNFINNNFPVFDICLSDETTLKTIIRANPGLLLLREGIILGKWNFRDAPDHDSINENMISNILLYKNKSMEAFSVLLLILLVCLSYLGFHLIFLKVKSNT